VANRYWVGGAGTWNTSSTTNWSASSGGASGASVPTAADSVFFDQAGTYTVTLTGALTCLDFTVSAGTVTFSSTGTPTISGSMSLLAGTVWSSTGAITFNATTTGKTVTTNGTTLNGSLTFSGVGGAWTLGSALTTGLTNSIAVNNGTFNSGGFAITTLSLNSNSASIRAINLSNSTINLGSSTTGGNPVNFTSTNLSFNAGTSQINILNTKSTTVYFYGGGKTFYNVAVTQTTSGFFVLDDGANTFNNLSIAAPFTTGQMYVSFSGNQTINGTLSTTGTAGNQRVFFASSTYGIGWTLTCNSAASLTDADFRDIYVIGTASPISGTRIGNRGNCTGITFDAPKIVYWNLAGAQNWSANAWATTSTGTPSTDNFPLPQDTATFTNAGSVTGTITLDSAFLWISSVDMSARTSAMTLAFTNATTWYGNWKNGSGTTLSGFQTQTLSGGSTQTITSAGIAFTCQMAVDTYGGTVQLADAFNIGANTLTVTNGTFNTANFSVTADAISSDNSNVRTISLGSSAVTLTANTPFVFTTSTNLTFTAGTSTITISSASSSSKSFNGAGVTFYNVSFTGNNSAFINITGANTFNNLLITASATAGYMPCTFSANQTINGTFTCGGGSAVQRGFVQSSVLGTKITLTVNSLSATDTDFRDITIAGTAAGTAPTRAGDCGNNSGITFPAPKTVYWNLAGTNNYSATAWCTASGGTPAVNNFPLPQDTAVFDNAGSITTVSVQTIWNIGTLDASTRTSAMTLSFSVNTSIYGNFKLGTGVATSGSANLLFVKFGTQTITCNGASFGSSLVVSPASPNTVLQLADAFTSGNGISITSGTFDSANFAVTASLFSISGANCVLKMGNSTWTITGAQLYSWDTSIITSTIFTGQSNIVFSNNTTTPRGFVAASGQYYNKITIGGSAISNFSLRGTFVLGELASTKTTAHTITIFSIEIYSIGKWSVTGTAGNVVTVQPSSVATAYTLFITGPANTGIDYLSISYCAVSTTSVGEFYVGANSTNTAGNTGPIFFTATPAARTLYWVGGTGNWSSTTKWSTSSGGASGASIPMSLDTVTFNSASNATAYTATIDAGVAIARCASFTMAGPASGNVTFAGFVNIAFHGNVSFAATGITNTYTGTINCVGNSSYTFITNGVTLGSSVAVNGIGSTWTLGSALNIGGNTVAITYGTFSTSSSGNYAVTASVFSSSNANARTINLNASTLTLSSIAIPWNMTSSTNATLNAGTSTINLSGAGATFAGGGQTFSDVSFTSTALTTPSITGANTFNNVSITGRTTIGIGKITFAADQTINYLTVTAGTASAYRIMILSSVFGTTRTLTIPNIDLTDVDFQDITGAGTWTVGGVNTRIGDCGGNSGNITFTSARTHYFAQTGSANWGATGTGSWASTSGGATNANRFPLAQDTAIFPAATYPASGSTTTINANYNIGTIDMSLRTSNTMTLATSTATPFIYGNWINGSGITLSGTGAMTFAGRTTQTITSVSKLFSQPIIINSPSGSVTLQDSFSTNAVVSTTLTNGTLNLNNFALFTSTFSSSGSGTRTLTFGSSSLVLLGTGTVWNMATSTNATINKGTGNISLNDTSTTAKTFAGGGLSYPELSIGGATGISTLTITGNNTFAKISSIKTVANTIDLGTTTQTVGAWTATGTSGNLLTITGTSYLSPATLIYTGAGSLSGVNYVVPTFVRAYPTTTTWSINNSTNGGSLGFVFTFSATATGNFFLMF